MTRHHRSGRTVTRHHRAGRTVTHRRLVRLAAALAAVTTLALVGCSSSPAKNAAGGPTPTVRGLTQDDAALLAQTLYKNTEQKGASFSLTTAFANGPTIHVQGALGWASNRGEATITVGADQPFDISWGSNAVLEQHAALAGALGKLKAGATWLARPANEQEVPLDRLLKLLSGLATNQPDNPTLVQQQQAGFVRNDTLSGHAVKVFRYGVRNLYFVGADDGLLYRLEAYLNGFTAATVIDLSGWGPQTQRGPKSAEVVSVTDPDAAAAYASFTATSALLKPIKAVPAAVTTTT